MAKLSFRAPTMAMQHMSSHVSDVNAMQTLGLLVGLTLRNPENAERAVEEGCVDVVIEVSTRGSAGTRFYHSTQRMSAVRSYWSSMETPAQCRVWCLGIDMCIHAGDGRH